MVRLAPFAWGAGQAFPQRQQTRSAFFSKGTAPTNVPAPTSLAIHSDTHAETREPGFGAQCIGSDACPHGTLHRSGVCSLFLGAHLWPLTLAPEGTGLVWAGSRWTLHRNLAGGGKAARLLFLFQPWLLWLFFVGSIDGSHTLHRHHPIAGSRTSVLGSSSSDLRWGGPLLVQGRGPTDTRWESMHHTLAGVAPRGTPQPARLVR